MFPPNTFYGILMPLCSVPGDKNSWDEACLDWLAASHGGPARRQDGVVCEVRQSGVTEDGELRAGSWRPGREMQAAFHAWGQLKRSVSPNILLL